MQDFFNNPRVTASIIPYQKDEDSFDKLGSIRSNDIIDDDLRVTFAMLVNGENYIFEIIYNFEAKELIAVSYNFLDDSKE